ncbi:hypothetical protein POPTR_001G138800v4 [Populus trichocarpa]|uniref:Uncharacterized protein n=1 Tax=Populus trichocarpa TaxID=3694 RepID=A0ACC0TJV6_POPTR|nr:hypothetical protein POPTR_001G138800v4 [Populus trichocarpa]
MTLVRERRHQQPLRLSLPPPIPAADFRHQIHSPSLSLTISPDSPSIEKLSDLEKLAVLGHGNSGTVYKVRHKRSSSIFALKTLRFDRNSTIIRQQAGREAEILRRVDSPYVVQCHAVFDSEDDLYFAMEHMERGSLHDVLLVHRILPEDVISGVARCILNGLQYLHEKQIVHGDIKPSNLLINAEGVVKIADFGVSRVVVGKHDSYETYMGTCAYMSPERIDPERWDWKWRSRIRRRCLVTWGGSFGVPGGSLSIDWLWRETRLGSIGVCYMLWGEIANAEECIQQDSKLC